LAGFDLFSADLAVPAATGLSADRGAMYSLPESVSRQAFSRRPSVRPWSGASGRWES